jgi:hypothetical protein
MFNDVEHSEGENRGFDLSKNPGAGAGSGAFDLRQKAGCGSGRNVQFSFTPNCARSQA